SPLERAVWTYCAPSTSSRLPRITRMLRATPPRPAISSTGQMCANISTIFAQLQGANTYCGEKKDEILGCFSSITRIYNRIIAIEKRGTDVKMKAKTASMLSQKPYFRGATKM